MSKIGIRDVAAHAGVSLGTVSNVLNGRSTVNPRNLERVQNAMKELGFVPNAHARQLRAARTGSIGFVVLNIANPFFAEIAHEAQAAAERHGSTMFLASSDQDPARESRFLTEFEESRVRGLLVAPVAGVTTRLEELHRRGTPIVLMDEHVDSQRFCSVSLDGTAGGYIAARHLLDIGRRRIAFVGGPIVQVADRVSGVGQAVNETPGALMNIFEIPDLTVEHGRQAARRIADLPKRDRPDGVFAGNDLVALGMLLEFEISKISVPDEIALVGYDDIEWARTAHVPITSVTQPRAELAEESIRLILEEEQVGPVEHAHRQLRLAPELVVRESTQR